MACWQEWDQARTYPERRAPGAKGLATGAGVRGRVRARAASATGLPGGLVGPPRVACSGAAAARPRVLCRRAHARHLQSAIVPKQAHSRNALPWLCSAVLEWACRLAIGRAALVSQAAANAGRRRHLLRLPTRREVLRPRPPPLPVPSVPSCPLAPIMPTIVGTTCGPSACAGTMNRFDPQNLPLLSRLSNEARVCLTT
jgi:hypothetical protein